MATFVFLDGKLFFARLKGMMMLIRFLFPFLFLFSFSAWSLHFDWSGWIRTEAYYQSSKDTDYYGSYHFALSPKIHVMDGLSVNARLDLRLIGDSSSSLPFYRQRGLILTSSGASSLNEGDWSDLFLNPSQFYIDYGTEFFTVRLGRAPYHFGLGAVYSASESPFQHWMSLYNQLSFYLEYSYFYFQPVFLNEKDTNRLLAQAGLLYKDWKLEAFYQHDFEEDALIQFYGQYEQPSWEVKSSLSYILKEQNNGAVTIEASTELPKSLPFKLEVKAGGAFGDFLFHPNYDLALLFWNHLITEKTDSNSELKIAEGQIQKGLYFSPRLLFSFFDESLQVRPIALVARSLEEKTLHYELDLEALYRLDKNLFFSAIGGALYSNKKSHFAFMAKAAVSF